MKSTVYHLAHRIPGDYACAAEAFRSLGFSEDTVAQLASLEDPGSKAVYVKSGGCRQGLVVVESAGRYRLYNVILSDIKKERSARLRCKAMRQSAGLGADDLIVLPEVRQSLH